MGKDPKTAAKDGAKEIAGAITASTLTTVAVFLPVVFISGLLGQLFKEFAFTISFSLFASLFVALTVIPIAQDLRVGKRACRAGGDPDREDVRRRVGLVRGGGRDRQRGGIHERAVEVRGHAAADERGRDHDRDRDPATRAAGSVGRRGLMARRGHRHGLSGHIHVRRRTDQGQDARVPRDHGSRRGAGAGEEPERDRERVRSRRVRAVRGHGQAGCRR